MEPGTETSPLKEVKLYLPIQTHVSLHSLKLLRSQSIQASVVAALRSYFDHHPVEAVAAFARF